MTRRRGAVRPSDPGVERACRGAVVVLVDEYDKPILDALEDFSVARANRDDLRGLYG